MNASRLRMQMLSGLGVASRVADRIAEELPKQHGRFEFRLADSGTEAELMLYEFIGYDWWTDSGMTAQRFADELAALGDVDTLTVRINSPGGDVWDGMSIYNQLATFDATVNVVIEGIAASAASLIAMAGDSIEAYEISQMMIHDAWTIAAGNEQDMREVADVLARVDGQIASAYAGKAGRPAAEFRTLMDSDTYLTATEAMELGLVDGIINTTVKPPANARARNSQRQRHAINLMRAAL